MSFKVICVDAGNGKYASHFPNSKSRLKEGDIYAVVYVFIHPYYKDEGYLLSEVSSDGYMGGYLSSRFAPLSTIDETELIKEREMINEH